VNAERCVKVYPIFNTHPDIRLIAEELLANQRTHSWILLSYRQIKLAITLFMVITRLNDMASLVVLYRLRVLQN
jgi:hypothetical protein